MILLKYTYIHVKITYNYENMSLTEHISKHNDIRKRHQTDQLIRE